MKVDLFGDGLGAVEYIDHLGDDLTVVNAARVSFGAQKEVMDDRDKKLIKYLATHNHSSPFEHCSITFRFTVPLFIRSQHHRHRTWAYNEISRRYTSVDMSFYEPSAFRKQHESNRQASKNEMINPGLYGDALGQRLVPYPSVLASEAVKNHHNSSLELYQRLIDSGVSREQARGVLPQNLYTQYYGTVNLHNLIKFIKLRQHSGAQWEIQEVAKACLQISRKFFPIAVGSYFEELENIQGGLPK